MLVLGLKLPDLATGRGCPWSGRRMKKTLELLIAMGLSATPGRKDGLREWKAGSHPTC